MRVICTALIFAFSGTSVLGQAASLWGHPRVCKELFEIGTSIPFAQNRERLQNYRARGAVFLLTLQN